MNAIVLPVAFRDIEGIDKIFRAIASVFTGARKYTDKIKIYKIVDDILTTKAENKVAVFMIFREAIPFEENLDLIELYYGYYPTKARNILIRR